MTRPDGTPVNAVYGFTNMLMKLLLDTHADHVAVVFDAARRTFRNDLYPDYKANRPEPPEELIPQFALVREATRALNVAAVEVAIVAGLTGGHDAVAAIRHRAVGVALTQSTRR